MQKLKKILFVGLLGLMAVNPTLALAQTTDVKIPPYQGVDSSISQFLCTPSEPADGHDVARCVNKLYRFGISFGAIAVVFFFVYAGYLYMIGGEKGKASAKEIMQNALIGMAFLLGSYLFLSFINPSLTIFKPIQPPIFSAPDLPSCADIGFEETCVINGEVRDPAAGSGMQSAQSCPDSIVNTDGKVPTKNNVNFPICKSLLNQLIVLYNNTKGQSAQTSKYGQWRISDTYLSPQSHDSDCHHPGNPKTGTCADFGFGPGESSYTGTTGITNQAEAEKYNWLCSETTKASGIIIHNEAVATSLNTACSTYNPGKKSTAAHIHGILGAGGGGGGSGGGGTGGGNAGGDCLPDKEFPGLLCANPLGDSGQRWKDEDWSNTDSKLRPAVNDFVSKMKDRGHTITIKQVYRSKQYGAFRRSVFEVGSIAAGLPWANPTTSKTYGQYCRGRSFTYFDQQKYNALSQAQKSRLATIFRQRYSGEYDNTNPPDVTCNSDHGMGIGFDIAPSPNGNASYSRVAEEVAAQVGLCHSARGDNPHFALTSGVKSQDSSIDCKWFTSTGSFNPPRP